MSVHIEGDIPEELSSRFEAIAAEENIGRDSLLVSAIAAFIREYEWKKAIQVGLDEVRQGHGIPHEEVMREMDELLRDIGK